MSVTPVVAKAAMDEYEPESGEELHRKCLYRLSRGLFGALIVISIVQAVFCCWLLNRAKPICPLADTERNGIAAECAEPYCAYNCPNVSKCLLAVRYRAPLYLTGFAVCALIGLAGAGFLLCVNPCNKLPPAEVDPYRRAGSRDESRERVEGFASFCTVVADVLVLSSSGLNVSHIGTDDARWVPLPFSIVVVAFTTAHIVVFCSFLGIDDLRHALRKPCPARRKKVIPLPPPPPPPAVHQPPVTKVDPTASAAVTVFPPNKCPDFDTTKHPQPQPPSDAASDKASALIIVAPPP